MNFNFASRRKLCKNSVFYEKINTVTLILCGKVFIFLRFSTFPFRKCIPLPNFFDIDILRESVVDLNISARSVGVKMTFLRICIESRWRFGIWLVRDSD